MGFRRAIPRSRSERTLNPTSQRLIRQVDWPSTRRPPPYLLRVVLLYWISYWINAEVLHFPANPCVTVRNLATECEAGYNPQRQLGSALAAAGGRHPAKFDTLGVTGSSPVAPTPEGPLTAV